MEDNNNQNGTIETSQPNLTNPPEPNAQTVQASQSDMNFQTEQSPQPNQEPKSNPAPQIDPNLQADLAISNYKTSRDPKIIRIAIIGVVAIVMIIGLSIFLSNLNKKDQSDESDKSSSTSKTEEKEDDFKTEKEKQALVKDVLNKVKEAATKNIDAQEQNITSQDVYDTNPPLYLPSSAKSAMPLEKSFGFIITADSNPELVKIMVGKASEELTKQGFTTYEDVEQDMSGSYGYINKDDKTICTPITNNETSLSLSCGHTSWLSTDRIALGNALAEAYKAEEGKYPANISADPDKIEDSPYRPYQKIVTQIANFAGLFYRASSDAEWVFFRGTQAAISCSIYQTDAGARHAFQGDVCLDSNNQMSTVKESGSAKKDGTNTEESSSKVIIDNTTEDNEEESDSASEDEDASDD